MSTGISFKLGDIGEDMAYRILKKNNFNLYRGDWLINIPLTKKWIFLEVKMKELWTAGPPGPEFDGTGLEISQVLSRMSFFNDVGVRTIVFQFIIQKGKMNYFNNIKKVEEIDEEHLKYIDCYWQYLDILENKGHGRRCPFQPIKIYPLVDYNHAGKYEEINLDNLYNGN